jgi:hypothetical protein
MRLWEICYPHYMEEVDILIFAERDKP